MRYNKKDFTLVPSRQARIGMPANQQVVYMWLCEHSDDNNQSFPSRKVLAYECGMSPSTLDRTLILLEKQGFIVRQNRYKENKQSSNLYTVFIVTKGSHIDEGGVVILNSPPSHIDEQNPTHLTQPISILRKEKNQISKKRKDTETQTPTDSPILNRALLPYTEMRKSMGKPVSPGQLKIILSELEGFHPGDIESQCKSLNLATAGGYLLPVKLKGVPSAAETINVGKLLHPDKY